MKAKENQGNIIFTVICCISLLVLIIFPLCMIFSRAIIIDNRLTLSNLRTVITDVDNLKTIKNSLLLGFTVVVISTFLSAPLSFLLARTSIGKQKWIDIVIMIPFMTPPFINSMGWILFTQRNGLFQQLFPFTGHISEVFFSFWGLALVMSLHIYPFMVSILKNALININLNLEEAGAIFGGTWRYRIQHILVPLLTGNYCIAALLVFVKTLSEYGTPYTLGTRIGFMVFTTDIHKHSTTAPVDFTKTASLSTVLIIICLVVWYGQNTITQRRTYQTLGGKGNRYSLAALSRSKKLIAFLYIIFLQIISIGVPYFSIICTSLIKLRGYGLAKGNFTLQHYVELFTQNEKALSAIRTSFLLAIAASIIATILGTFISVTLHYTKKRKIKQTVEAISLLPEMLPGIVLVIGLMLFWNKIYRYIPLYNTLGFMVLTYVVLFLPFTVQYVNSSFSQVQESLMQGGRVFGGTPFFVFCHITLPLIFRGIFTGWMMTFIISFRELVAPSMIAPPNVLTISTYIVREFEQGSVSSGMAMAVIYAFFTTIFLLFINVLNRKRTS